MLQVLGHKKEDKKFYLNILKNKNHKRAGYGEREQNDYLHQI
jgi:hypothetical protein